MSGHSKWSQIKHQKAITDHKRGQIFSKLLNAIAIAARLDPNPEYNPRLRTAIQKAKEANVPNENIDRAIARALESTKNLEEIFLEAYGPGGVAILIEVITDNKNQIIAEIKKILNTTHGKWAEPGSVRWAFEKENQSGDWQAKFKKNISEEDSLKLNQLISLLQDHSSVQKIFTDTEQF